MLKNELETELNIADYEILNFINHHVTKERLFNKFPNAEFSTEYRIQVLSSQSLNLIKEPIPNFYSLTDKGLKVLSDHKKKVKEEKTKIFKTSFLYPAIAIAITYTVCSLLEKYFK